MTLRDNPAAPGARHRGQREWRLLRGRRHTEQQPARETRPLGEREVQLPRKGKDTVHENPFNAAYLQRLKDHDPETEAHYAGYFRLRLRMKLRGRWLQDSDIEDVIQDTLLRGLKAIYEDKVRSPESFGAFISHTCDNVLFEKQRIDRPLDQIDLEAFDPPDGRSSLEVLLLRKERRKIVERVLKEDLNARDRNFLRARFFDGLTAQQMCERFDSDCPATMRVTLHRACLKFEEACKKRGLDFFRG